MKYVDLICKVLVGQFSTVVSRYMTGLCCFEMACRGGAQKRKYFATAMQNLKIIREWSAKGNPNTQHYLLSLRAEKDRYKEKTGKAVSLYKEAILRAGRSGFNHDQALVSERLSSLYKKIGDKVSAKYCLEDASKLYREWGAAKKVELLAGELKDL